MALHSAVLRRDVDGVREILASSVDPNSESEKQERLWPLHSAAAIGDTQIIQALADARALVDASEPVIEGKTPLHLAAENAKAEALVLLISLRADVDVMDGGSEKAALHFAAANADGKAVQALVDAGADINAYALCGLFANGDASTPLHFAARCSNVEAVRILVRARADINASNLGGATPLDVAKKNNCDDVVALLEGRTVITLRPRAPDGDGVREVACLSLGGNKVAVLQAGPSQTVGGLCAELQERLGLLTLKLVTEDATLLEAKELVASIPTSAS